MIGAGRRRRRGAAAVVAYGKAMACSTNTCCPGRATRRAERYSDIPPVSTTSRRCGREAIRVPCLMRWQAIADKRKGRKQPPFPNTSRQATFLRAAGAGGTSAIARSTALQLAVRCSHGRVNHEQEPNVLLARHRSNSPQKAFATATRTENVQDARGNAFNLRMTLRRAPEDLAFRHQRYLADLTALAWKALGREIGFARPTA